MDEALARMEQSEKDFIRELERQKTVADMQLEITAVKKRREDIKAFAQKSLYVREDLFNSK